MRAVASLAQLTLVAATLCGPVSASPSAFESPREGDRLRPGQLVDVRWDFQGIEGVKECEVLLHLGEGLAPLRLTGELEGETTSFRWLVPNLSVSGARLGVRVGIRGRELELPASAPFEIVGDPSAGLETIERRDGELWLSAGGSPSWLAGRSLAPREAGFSGWTDPETWAVAKGGREPVARPKTVTLLPRVTEPGGENAAALSPAFATQPLTVPLRN